MHTKFAPNTLQTDDILMACRYDFLILKLSRSKISNSWSKEGVQCELDNFVQKKILKKTQNTFMTEISLFRGLVVVTTSTTESRRGTRQPVNK